MSIDVLSAVVPVVLTYKQFLVLETCPEAWQKLDLYLVRDAEVVFYVGQSYLAFDRVWRHIRDGFKGRSLLGRFLLCNWPASLKFTIELWSSQAEAFAAVGHDLSAAERQLIQQWTPCLNEALNPNPTPLPARYAPATAKIRCSRSLTKLIHQAEIALAADARQQWLADGWGEQTA